LAVSKELEIYNFLKIISCIMLISVYSEEQVNNKCSKYILLYIYWPFSWSI